MAYNKPLNIIKMDSPPKKTEENRIENYAMKQVENNLKANKQLLSARTHVQE
jgi:hypothetical protein